MSLIDCWEKYIDTINVYCYHIHMPLDELIKDAEGFDWDQGNWEKNLFKYDVTRIESEQVFFKKPRLLSEDKRHSQKEKRYGCLGRTYEDRKLLVIFTMRGKLIRIISARNQNRKERTLYAKKTKVIT